MAVNVAGRLARFFTLPIAAAVTALALSAAPAAAQDQVNELALMVPSSLGDPILGNPDAEVTVIEYASMTCPHCRDWHNQVYADFKAEYIDTGLVRFIIREFPLDNIATAAFMLARCAQRDFGDLAYFGLIETLFENQSLWVVQQPLPPLLQLATQAGFTQQTFQACLEDQAILDGVYENNDRGATEFAVSGTPTFFINGVRYGGAQSIEDLREAIDPLLE